MKKIRTEEYVKLMKKAYGKQKWSNAPGSLIVELIFDPENGWYDMTNDKEFPEQLKDVIAHISPEDSAEMEIEFTSSGYERAAITGGPADMWEPAEGEDERIVTAVNIYNDGRQVGSLPKEFFPLVENVYEKEIAEIDVDRNDGPEDHHENRFDYDRKQRLEEPDFF